MARANKAVPRWDEENGRWILQRQVNGRRKTFTSPRPGRAGSQDCVRQYNQWLAEGQAEDPRLREVWQDYLDDIQARKGPGSNAWRTADQIGRANILPELGARKIGDITEQDLQDLLNTARREDGSRYSRKTVENIRSEISLLYKYLKKAGHVDWRPDTLEIPYQLQYEQKNILQKEHAAALLADTTLDPYLMAWQMMLLTGFRPGEVYGLQWSDISEDAVEIKRSLNDKRQITPGKNKNAQRIAYLIDPVKDVLRRAIQWHDVHDFRSKWIFVTRDGEPIWTSTSSRKLHTYCRENGLPDVTPYRLRHTFVSLSKSHLTEIQLKQVVGHSESMDTLGTYAHSLTDDHVAIGRLLDGMFRTILGES